MSVVLLGYSGHGIVVAEAAISSGMDVLGYAEKKMSAVNPFGLKYLGDENIANFNWSQSGYFILGVGSNNIRRRIAEFIESQQGKCLTVVHPEAKVSELTNIGSGSFIARNVSVNPLVERITGLPKDAIFFK